MRTAIAFSSLLLTLFGCVNVLRGDGFLYSNGVFTQVQVPGADSRSVTASGINDAGQIVGTAFIPGGGELGFYRYERRVYDNQGAERDIGDFCFRY